MNKNLPPKHIAGLIILCFGAFAGMTSLGLWIQYPSFFQMKNMNVGYQVGIQNDCTVTPCGTGYCENMTQDPCHRATGNNQTSISSKKPVTMLAMGDIMLSRSVASTIKKSNDPLLPFSQLATLLQSVDFSFANLETPITQQGGQGTPGSMVFNTPEEYALGLKTYGFEVLNLANNHAYDQGKDGLLQTMKYLEKNNIKTVGVGETQKDAWTPVIKETRGTKICFIGASYASINDGGQEKNENVARMDDPEILETSILQARSLCDFVVATMHAGTEYTRSPNASQKLFARTAIKAGADIVIGAHPHWIQTIERYCPYQIGRTFCQEPKYIFYSLGNFIFDQEWSQETKEGLMLQILFEKNQGEKNMLDIAVKNPPISIELMPVIIENYSTPRLAEDGEKDTILRSIHEAATILQ